MLDDTVARQFSARAYAGEQQQLWRVDRAGAKDHLSACLQLRHLAGVKNLHTSSALALQHYPVGQRVTQYREIGSVEDGVKEGACGAATLAIDLRDVEGAYAFLLLAIEVSVIGPAHFLPGLVEHWVDRARAALLGHIQLTAATVPG